MISYKCSELPLNLGKPLSSFFYMVSYDIQGTAKFLRYSWTWLTLTNHTASLPSRPRRWVYTRDKPWKLHSIHVMVNLPWHTIYIPHKKLPILEFPQSFQIKGWFCSEYLKTLWWHKYSTIHQLMYTFHFPSEVNTRQAWCLITWCMNQTLFYLAKEIKWDNNWKTLKH